MLALKVSHVLTTFLLLAASVPARATQKKHLRVINGEPDTAHEFPFAVVLELKEDWGHDLHVHVPGVKRGCSGSMITDSWVITAGHCISPKRQSPYVVRYGNVTVPRQETRSFSKILEWIQHPDYENAVVIKKSNNEVVPLVNVKHITKRVLSHNDIGMLRVEKVPIKTFAKLSAVDYMSLIGESAKYAGFGMVDVVWSKDALDKPLRVGEAAIIKCHDEPETFPGICLAPKCGKSQSAYYGDSGGPLVSGGKLVGVASQFKIYTPVSPYLTWIRDTMNKPNTHKYK